MKRIGVFVCHCGSNIAATVDVKKVVELAWSDDDDLEALLKTICGEYFFGEND